MAKKRATLENVKRDRRADNPGRPSRYNPDVHPKVAKAMCAKGATISELANAFGVCIATIWNWKVTYPEFTESYRLGLEAAIDRVERSVFERAVGYTFDSVKVMMCNGAPVKVRYLKHIPPDPRAGEFWLTNRRPDRWKHNRSIEHNEAPESPTRIPRGANLRRRNPPAPSRDENIGPAAAEPNAANRSSPVPRQHP